MAKEAFLDAASTSLGIACSSMPLQKLTTQGTDKEDCEKVAFGEPALSFTGNLGEYGPPETTAEGGCATQIYGKSQPKAVVLYAKPSRRPT